jgi:hypothetical protein
MNRRVFFITILTATFSKDRWEKWFPPKKIIPKWDPNLITMVRKVFHSLIEQQLCNVPPIHGTASEYLRYQKEAKECNNLLLNSRYETN